MVSVQNVSARSWSSTSTMTWLTPSINAMPPWSVAVATSGCRTAEVLVDLAALPVGAEEPPDSEQHDAGDGDGDARPEHRPVEPPGAAVVGEVDQEPHDAEGDPDTQHDVEDPLAAHVAPSVFQRLVIRHRVRARHFVLPSCHSSAARVWPRGPACSTCRRGIHSSQLGRYQFHSPSSFIALGRSTDLMTVASMRSATATPKPICWNMIRSPRAKPENTATMISAALVMMRAVDATPNVTASVGSPVWMWRSRSRLSRNTW